jgi:hypothetical protein
VVKEDIETVIDRLYDYINANKQTRVKDAATILALPEEQVEKLAFLLEDSNLIEVRYSLTGATLVSKAKTEPKHVTAEEAKESFAGKAGLLEEQVASAESIAEFMEKDLMRRLKDAEANLKALEAQKNISQFDVKKLAGEMNYLSERMESFEKAVKQIEERGGGLSSEIGVFQKRLKILEKTKMEKPVQQKLMEFLIFYILFLKTMLQKIVSSRKKAAQPTELPKPVPLKPTAAEKKKEVEAKGTDVVFKTELKLPKIDLPKVEMPKAGFHLPQIKIPKVEIEFLPAKNAEEKRIEEIKTAILEQVGMPAEKAKPSGKAKFSGKSKQKTKQKSKQTAKPLVTLPKWKMPKIKFSKTSKSKKLGPTAVAAFKGMVKTARGFDRVMEKRRDAVRQHYWRKKRKKK